ncbi:MAG: hypothetical protein ACK5TM_15940, partial [Methylobacterium sp.]
MPKCPSPPPSPLKPDRRQLLAGLALGASLGPSLGHSLGPALAQPAPAPRPAAQPRAAAATPPSPIQNEQLSAVSLTARLTGDQSPESTLFRFRPDPAPAPQASPPDIPALRFQPAGDARIGLRNDLAQPDALALRGLRRTVTGDATNGIGAGQAGSLSFPTSQPGSFLLKAVPPAPSREARARGLHAAVIVEEPRPPDVDHDIPLLVGDWRLNEKGELAGDFTDLRDAARLGRLGNRLSVNGREAPLALTVRP